MIEISGFIHQLDVSESQEKHDNCQSVFITNGNQKSREPADNKNEIGEVSERMHPLKTVIGKEKIGFDIKFMNPAFGPKPNDGNEHHGAK
jgi:hypothetical protein